MSTHVIGFSPPDETWQRMEAVWDACHAAGIDPPVAVSEFFDDEPPDTRGVLIDQRGLEKCGAVKAWRDETREGYEVEIAKLPNNVKFIRMYNAY